MNFAAEMIKKVADFVNLGKMLVDGGPGVILAIALAVIAANSAHLPLLPYSTHLLVLDEGAVSCTEAEPEGDPGLPFQAENAFERHLLDLRGEILKLRKRAACLATGQTLAEGESSVRDKAVGEWGVQLAALRMKLAELQGQDALGTGRLEGEISDLEEQRRALLRAGSDETVPSPAQRQRLLDAADAEILRLTEEFNALRATEVRSLGSLFSFLLDHLIGLALVGWVLGTIFSPLNRTLLQQGTDGAVELKTRQAVEEIDSADKRLAFQAFSIGTSRLGSEKTDEEKSKELTQHLSGRSMSYFIGREIVSQSEKDELISTYYRWAEMAGNLLIPFFVLGLACHQIADGEDWFKSPYVFGGFALLLLMVGLTLSGAGSRFASGATSGSAAGQESRSFTLREGMWLAFVLAVVITVGIALSCGQPPARSAGILAWSIGMLAWLRGREGFYRYRKVEAEFLLGRIAKIQGAARTETECVKLQKAQSAKLQKIEQLLTEAAGRPSQKAGDPE